MDPFQQQPDPMAQRRQQLHDSLDQMLSANHPAVPALSALLDQASGGAPAPAGLGAGLPPGLGVAQPNPQFSIPAAGGQGGLPASVMNDQFAGGSMIPGRQWGMDEQIAAGLQDAGSTEDRNGDHNQAHNGD